LGRVWPLLPSRHPHGATLKKDGGSEKLNAVLIRRLYSSRHLLVEPDGKRWQLREIKCSFK